MKKMIKLKLEIQKYINPGVVKNILKTPKKNYIFFLLFLCCLPVFSQTGGASEVTSKINQWGQTIKTILNAVVGIFSFVGGFLIFIQYMQGNEQAQKNFIRFIIGLAIFGLVALIANIFIDGNVTP
ncbi:DUF4134 family protein [Abyssalbus ytuae]|uniref:DUF4134 family protein n=1 Tax=Abyssalbus ytuae TaxID=2926907 RepID=A0A9E6ZVA4_9FLAO|nr:DUF4134 family protein [Abyssalbus ytuae]UOB18433.1 DUF4134 family protein [Abyssalbus ytuae]